ncbi:hypothetical protein EV356DRAFT_513822 [Viridothelium virens]|uniref:DNA-binding protein RAP1 n=1 Tax=Viridothelium virens TaxID=1048519 RepID=A0A6A6HN07_VIRVR|nr:hypothetical protein EV356DRAFT_513822 [Viridothelium virens]
MSSTELIKAAGSSTIFQGLRFWVAQRCPTRSEYARVIEYLGGEVVPLEKQADYRIVDHLRKDNPEGSLSYQWIEQSCKKGKLEPEKDYLQGPSRSATRTTSSIRSGKSGRTPFTTEDDRVLRNWVEDWERRGAKALGNEIYKALERENPRHPWQAWRDRYVKYVQKSPHKPQSNPTPPTPPLENNISEKKVKNSSNEEPTEKSIRQVDEPSRVAGEDKYEDFTQGEFEELLEQAPGISMMKAQTYISEVWVDLEKDHPEHTARRWRSFYEDEVHPVYMEQKKQHAESQPAKSTTEALTYQEQGEKPRMTELNATNAALTQTDNESHTSPEHRGSSELRRSSTRATSNGSREVDEEMGHIDDGTRDGIPIHTGQAHGSPVRKRLPSDEAEGVSDQGEHTTPAHKKKRLQSPQPSFRDSSPPNLLKSDVPSSFPALVKPRVTNLSSDEEDGHAHEASEDEAEEIPPSDNNIAIDNATESADSVEPSPDGMPRDSTRQTSKGKMPRERYSTTSEARQTSDEGNESADSQSSFDPVTSSAIARAMTGKVPKSGSHSTQNTPHTPSRMRRSEQARSTFDRLRNESENSSDLPTEFITPTKLRGHGNGEAGPSRSSHHIAQKSDSLAAEARQMPEPSGALSALSDKNGAIVEENDNQTVDEDDLDGLNDEGDSIHEGRLSEEAETQAFFDAPTQQPDIDFLDPDGGVDELDNFASNSHSNCYDSEDQKVAADLDTAPKARLRQETVETQALFDADTLDEADLRIPSPETSFIQGAPPSSLPSQHPEQRHDPQSDMAELREWMRDLVGAGHDYNQVVRALQATCLDTGLALQILPGLESGESIPENMMGVWTAQDDEHLEGSDGRLLKRLSKKHGDHLMTERREFLRDWRLGTDAASNT